MPKGFVWPIVELFTRRVGEKCNIMQTAGNSVNVRRTAGSHRVLCTEYTDDYE